MHEMKRMLTVLCLLFLASCTREPEAEPADHFLRTISLPRVSLAEGERISGLQIDMACGRFKSINRIPNDWSLSVDGPVSERSTLKAQANHGVSWLSNNSNFLNFAMVMVCSTSQFDVAVKVFINDGERTQRFTMDQLHLEELHNNRMDSVGESLAEASCTTL